MIYLFSGDDSKKRIDKYEKLLKTFTKEIEVFTFGRNNFDPVTIESFYRGGSLFFKKSVLIFPFLLEKEEVRDFVLSKIEYIANSENIFIFIESKLNKATLDAFKKVSANIETFELPKAQKERFDNFLLANAFANKDKLNLWIYFRQAVDKGVVMEELIGVLSWKIKDMILKKNFVNYSPEKLKNTFNKLSCLLPEARKKGLDAEVVFEKFLLEIV